MTSLKIMEIKRNGLLSFFLKKKDKSPPKIEDQVLVKFSPKIKFENTNYSKLINQIIVFKTGKYFLTSEKLILSLYEDRMIFYEVNIEFR